MPSEDNSYFVKKFMKRMRKQDWLIKPIMEIKDEKLRKAVFRYEWFDFMYDLDNVSWNLSDLITEIELMTDLKPLEIEYLGDFNRDVGQPLRFSDDPRLSFKLTHFLVARYEDEIVEYYNNMYHNQVCSND